MDKLEKIYLDIYQIYQDVVWTKSESVSNAWTQVAQLMDLNTELFHQIYHKHPETTYSKLGLEMGPDYLPQLSSNIQIDNDPSNKFAMIVTGLHFIIYDLFSTEPNYYFKLIGKEQMQVLVKDITYYIHISIKNEQNIFFNAFVILFALESLFDSHLYVGIDYEFTQNKIRLCQMNFEHNISLKSFIIIINPAELNEKESKTFIDLLITNPNLKKILHGSDSKDIPWMFDELLESNPKKIIDFTKTMIDTRFLCEYYKLSRSQTSEHKCAIYGEEDDRSAVYYFGVVSKAQQDALANILANLPPPTEREWYIHNMAQVQVLYAQYDVIFLKYFYYRIIYVATKDGKTLEEKKEIIDLYRYILYELTQFLTLENNEITFLRNKCKEEIDPMNNYMIRKPGEIHRLIDIYKNVSQNIQIYNPRVDLDKVMEVKHYVRTLRIILTKMTFTILSRRCTIYENKNKIWSGSLTNQFIFDFFDKLGLKHLSKMFQQIEKVLSQRLLKYC